MILTHDGVLAPVKSFNSDDVASRTLQISHLDDNKLYTATTEELPILIIQGSKFVKNPNNQVTFHTLTSYSSAKMFWEEPRAVFLDHCIEYALDLLSFWTQICLICAQQAFSCWECYSPVCVCTSSTQRTGKEFTNLGLKVVSSRFSETSRSFSRTLILYSRRRW